ncbi:MAG: DUF2231 domain-containing protein [Rhodanobacteraceae bacterium]
MRHPLHPILAHFPVACWSLATIADIASPRYGPPAWHLAGTLLWIGLLIAIPTILVGLFELIQGPREPAPVRAGFTHMGVMVLAFLLYAVSLLLRVHEGHIISPGVAARTLSVIGFVLLLVGGWLGGTLVYGYGVGGGKGRPKADGGN